MADAAEPEVKEIRARILPEEYEALIKAADELGISPNDFLRKAITDQALITAAVGKGGRVVLKSRFGSKQELVTP